MSSNPGLLQGPESQCPKVACCGLSSVRCRDQRDCNPRLSCAWRRVSGCGRQPINTLRINNVFTGPFSHHARSSSTNLIREHENLTLRLVMESGGHSLKSVRFNHRGTWCCLVLIVPIVIPILMYIKDMAILHRIFIGCFIIMVAIIVASVSLVFFQTFMQRMGLDQEWDPDNFSWLPLASNPSVLWRNLGRRTSVVPQVPNSTDLPNPPASPQVPSETGCRTRTISGYISATLAAQEIELHPVQDENPPPYEEAVSVTPCATHCNVSRDNVQL